VAPAALARALPETYRNLRNLRAVSKVPAVCRYFGGCELLAISGNRRCIEGEKSALMIADEVELL
jgi:hypothetical protein